MIIKINKRTKKTIIIKYYRSFKYRTHTVLGGMCVNRVFYGFPAFIIAAARGIYCRYATREIQHRESSRSNISTGNVAFRAN